MPISMMSNPMRATIGTSLLNSSVVTGEVQTQALIPICDIEQSP